MDLASLLAQCDASVIDRAMRLDPDSSDERVRVYSVPGDASVVELVLAGFDATTAEAMRDGGESDLFEALPALRSEVECAVSSSMVSGIWTLYSFRLKDRGYFCTGPDDVPEAAYLLYGGWEPYDLPDAYRRGFIETYVRSWDSIGLPPYMGEHAHGPVDLMVEAIMRIDGPLAIYREVGREIHDRAEQMDAADIAVRAGISVVAVKEILERLRTTRSLEEPTDAERQRALLAVSVVALDTSPFR